MNLAHADAFLFSGEWQLALDEIAAVMQERPDLSSPLADTMLSRAQNIMLGASSDKELT